MTEPQTYTTNRGWPIVRKASSTAEQRDWFLEEVTFAEAIDADVQSILDWVDDGHHLTHENGGSDKISIAGLSGKAADAQTPLAHKASHEDGGADEISIAGLSGVASQAQKTNSDGLTIEGIGAITNKLSSRAGLQNAFDWGGRVDTVHGPLVRLIHDVDQAKRAVEFFFGESGPDAVTNGSFEAVTGGIYPTGWIGGTAYSSLLQVQIAEKSPEGPNSTKNSTTVSTVCGRLINLSSVADAVYAYQDCLTIGYKYLISGWVRSEPGNPTGRVAQVWADAVKVAEAPTDGKWYWFEEIVEATTATLMLGVAAGAVGSVQGHFARISAVRIDDTSGHIRGDADGNILIKDTHLTVPVPFFNGELGNTVLANRVGGGSSLIGVLHDFSFVNTFSFMNNRDTAQLTAASAVEQMCVATQNANAVKLPDATTLTVARRFRIVNAGTEIIRVENYGTASSVFEFLLPGEILLCTLIDKGTPQGVWTCIRFKSEKDASYFNDFIGMSGTSYYPEGGRTTFGAGSNVVVCGQQTAAANKMYGVCLFSLGTDAGLGGWTEFDAFTYSKYADLLNTIGPLHHRVRMMCDTRSDGTNTFLCRSGIFDRDNIAQPVTGIYFEADTAGALSLVARKAGLQTALALGVNLPQGSEECADLHWLYNAGRTRLDCFQNKTYVGNITTNLMQNGDVHGALSLTAKRVAGTANRSLIADLLEHRTVRKA